MMNKTQNKLNGLQMVERPRYYARQLITPDDMIQEQTYFRNRMRLHNRMLHGWGVVCGLLVTPATTKNGGTAVEPWQVRVCPGYALGPQGDEIIMACEHLVDMRQNGVTGTAADPCGAADPWCSDVWISRDPGARYYIAIKFKELAVRPQRVQPAGCGCDDNQCEFSRWRDGYEIGVLTQAEYLQISTEAETPPAWNTLFQPPDAHNPACHWPTSAQSWVVLAHVELDDDGRPVVIDNCKPRRLVASLADFYWRCDANIQAQVTPNSLVQGAQETLTFTGKGFQAGLTVVMGKDISISGEPTELTDESFKVEVVVTEYAAVGPREIMLINPDCTFARTTITVEASGEVEPGTSPPLSVEGRMRRLSVLLKADARDEVEAANNLSIALTMPAVSILGIGATSTVGETLIEKGMTIGDVGRMTADEFVAELGVGTASEKEHAHDIHAIASMIADIVKK